MISSNLTASQEKQSWEKKLQNIRREKPVNGWWMVGEFNSIV